MRLGLTDRRRLPKRLALLVGVFFCAFSVSAIELHVDRGVQLDLTNIFLTQLGTTLVDESGYDGLRSATEKYVALELATDVPEQTLDVPRHSSTNETRGAAADVKTAGQPQARERASEACTSLRPERLIVDSRTYRVVGVLARSPVFPTPTAADAYFNRCLRAVFATRFQGRPMTRLVNGFAVRYPSSAGERIFTCERNTLDGTGRTQFALAVVDAQSGLAALKSARVQKTVQSRSTYFRQPQTKK